MSIFGITLISLLAVAILTLLWVGLSQLIRRKRESEQRIRDELLQASMVSRAIVINYKNDLATFYPHIRLGLQVQSSVECESYGKLPWSKRVVVRITFTLARKFHFEPAEQILRSTLMDYFEEAQQRKFKMIIEFSSTQNREE